MKITQADIAAIRAAVKEHAPGRRTIEVGVRTHANDGAPTIDSTQWDEAADLDNLASIREIVGQPKVMGMVLDLYIYDSRGRLENLDAQWVAENRWNVFDPFRLAR